MDSRIAIQGIGTLSAMDQVETDMFCEEHCLSYQQFDGQEIAVAKVPDSVSSDVAQLRLSNRKYQRLDRSVLLSMLASRKAMEQCAWEGKEVGVNIGSSRGATELFEGYYKSFLNGERVDALTSPTTSLGNLATWVANDLRVKGLAFSHSITCSTAMHALLNGIAWIKAGMADNFLVGGTEAPLTDFTLAQMRALKIYSPNNTSYPCRALDLKKTENTFVLGEGTGTLGIQKGLNTKSLAWIQDWGYSQEAITHHTSISENAACFYESMKKALGNRPVRDIDAIVMHAPGTLQGDRAEYNAIANLFGDSIPFLTSNKWKIGHTLGASGILSIELALAMINRNRAVGVPYIEHKQIPKEIRNIMVNAAGFGGNAVSIIVSRNPLKE
jgi:3-oxoacyl-(acyl-carrier-protein) synthase